MLESFALDSCKIRIPLEKCEIINESLYAHWYTQEVNIHTGEVRDGFLDFKGKAYKHSANGISTRCTLEKQMTADKTSKEFLTFAIHSKMLKDRYFEGITQGNSHIIWEYLNSLELAKFSLEDFQKGDTTDCDFKIDFLCDSLSLLIDKMKSISQPTKVADKGYRAFMSSTNMGIQWSNRKSTAISRPFYKIYSKELDLMHNSTDFAQAYLPGQSFKDITRAEFTIKNKKHFRTHGIDQTSLENILNLTQGKMSAMMQVSLSKHIMRAIRPKKGDTMSAKEQKVFNLIQVLQMGTIGINEGKYLLYSNLHPKTRKRDEEYFDEVWNKHFSKLPKSEQLNHLEKWLKIVGVQFV